MKLNRYATIYIFVIMTMIFITGCGTLTQQKASVCNDIPIGQTSVICEVADSIDVSPEYVNYLMKVGNITALAAETYTARKALEFVEAIDIFLADAQNQGLTYALVVKFVKEKYVALPQKVKIAFIVLQEFVDPPEIYAQKPLTDYDYSMLQAGIEEQYKIIRPFLVAE